MKTNRMPAALPTDGEMIRAFAARDSTYDAVFYVAVKTTGIFCRPSCPSRPDRRNIEFFPSARECLEAGYRPCKRCAPLEANGVPPAWIARLLAQVESSPEARLKSADLRRAGVSPERVRRWFQQHYGMSFARWCRGRRMVSAFTQIRAGAPLDDVILGSGFESHSGFRTAFHRVFGNAPGRMRREGDRLVLALLDSPLGQLLAGATDEGILLLDFPDRRSLEENIAGLRRRFGPGVAPGEHPFLDQLRVELGEYFAGRRKTFSVPLAMRGTPFQEKVWGELRRIPCGSTISYEELAARVGQPRAMRAVARTNSLNRICILIPCHRVIGKDGSLSGYGGGMWRKRLLLELERTGQARQSGLMD